MASSPSLKGLGGAGSPQKTGMGPWPHDWGSLSHKVKQMEGARAGGRKWSGGVQGSFSPFSITIPG